MRSVKHLLLVSTLATGSAAGCAATTTASEENVAVQALEGGDQEAAARHQLIAWAALPQSERRVGPTSGHFITAANGVTPPFENAQPIPGWSGLLAAEDGETFIAMPDN